MKVTIDELEAYLLDHYSHGGIDQSLFMKLVEEIGEVAEVLNKKAGKKAARKGSSMKKHRRTFFVGESNKNPRLCRGNQ